jgi:hypothetical protein
LNTRFHDTVTKSEPRLMSTAPSYPLLNELWSIQMFVDDDWTLIASSSQPVKFRFRMMTLRSSLRFNPPPVIVFPVPAPTIVLFEAT